MAGKHTSPRPGTSGDGLTLRLWVGGLAITFALSALACFLTGGTLAIVSGAVLVVLTPVFGAWAIWWPAIAEEFPAVMARTKLILPRVQAIATPLLLLLLVAVGLDFYAHTKEAKALEEDQKKTGRIDTLQDALESAMTGEAFTVPAGYPDAGKTIHLKRTGMGYMFLGTPTEQQKQQLQFQQDLDSSSDPVVQTLLRGNIFKIPSGYSYAGEQAGVAPTRFLIVNQRSGPCINAPGVKHLKVNKETCGGHPENFHIPNAGTVDLTDVHQDDQSH